MESQEVERMLRSLANIALHMSRVSDDLRAAIVELQEFNRQQLGISERLIRLLESTTGQGENGHA
jgi:signal transduction histidine kinase